jgi:prepilin-type N-terminal cleavage/methylation domain-containing protein
MSGRTPRRPHAQAGLSLLELLIVLMLMGIIAAMTLPIFGGGVSTTQLKSAAREIAAGLRLARNEAVASRHETVLTIRARIRCRTTSSSSSSPPRATSCPSPSARCVSFPTAVLPVAV